MSKIQSRITTEMQHALTSNNHQDYAHILSVIAENQDFIESELKETFQDEMAAIVEKIKNKKQISPMEKELIKMRIVGDATSYIEQENNFNDWMEEYKRLKKVLREYENEDLNLKQMLELRGIMEDAYRVISDIENYLKKKDRIERFERTLADPHADLSILTDILES